MVANGLTSVSQEAAEELKDYDLVTEEETESGVEVARKLIGSVVFINLICSVLITVPPIFLNAVLVKKCGEYYSLSDKPGFPQFMTIIESRDAYRYSEAVRNIENYNSAYGVDISAYAAEISNDSGSSAYGETTAAAMPSSAVIPEYHDERSFADRAINNEGTQYIKDMILKYREQITKTPENVFDYTVLSSLIVYINALLGLHVMAFVFALLEIIFVLFFLLPRNYKLVYVAFVFHILETITMLGGGTTKEGIFGQFVFVFTGILSVVQVVFYFMTARMLKKESDAEFERQRQLRKERAEAERQRKIIEEEDRIRQDIERRKVAASGNYGMEAVSPAVPVTNEDVPQQNYSSWSKVDTDLASSMLSDLNE